MSPAEKGTCTDSLPRFAYNINMAKCLPFDYRQTWFFITKIKQNNNSKLILFISNSGCDGNLNNFVTIQECEKVCDILIQMSRQAAGIHNWLLSFFFSSLI